MSRLLYNLAIYLSIPYALWRLYKRYGGCAVPWREYFGYYPPAAAGERLVWVHSVSLGEAIAARPLVEQLQKDGYRLLLTYTTPAGRDWLRQHYPQAHIKALPLDLPSAVRRFFDRLQPVAGIIMEAEYWHNLLTLAKSRGVPLMLANARLGKNNSRRYRHIAGLMRRMVSSFDIIAAQTARDAGRLRCFGARRVVTTGNLKFDLPIPPAEKSRLHSKPTVLFAVTRSGEEQLLLAAADKNFWRDFFVLLAPRHPQRAGDIAALAKQHQIRCQLRSQHAAVQEECQLYIADTMGEMHQWYAGCDVAVIGGSFLPHGGQNPIEAMGAGVAVVVGPYMDNYIDLVRRAAAAGALVQAADSAAACAAVRRLLSDSAARKTMGQLAQEFYHKYSGALQQHITLLQSLLATTKRI